MNAKTQTRICQKGLLTISKHSDFKSAHFGPFSLFTQHVFEQSKFKFVQANSNIGGCVLTIL